MGFGLVTEFTEYLQTVTKSNYCAIANSHSAIHYSPHLSLLSLLCLHQFSGSSFQLQTLGSRTDPMPQLPASNSNSSQGLSHSSPLTH
jgi:hypothetical protein